MHTVFLTTESGTALSASEMDDRIDAFVLISGQINCAGSIFGPYPIKTARFIADQAQADADPFALLSEFDSSRALDRQRQARTLISQRF